MRTKTLLLTVALSAACAIPSIAQVYSVNAVGYVNTVVPQGFSMICNPLVQAAADATVAKLIPNPTPATTIYKFDNAVQGYDVTTFDDLDLVWGKPNMTLDLGGGFFIYNPGAQFTVTFVGEVAQGTLNNLVKTGFTMQSSKVPQAGSLTALFPNYAGGPNDTVYKYSNASGYSTFRFDDLDLVWLPSVPDFAVGEAFFMYRAAANGETTWTRTFNVNQ